MILSVADEIERNRLLGTLYAVRVGFNAKEADFTRFVRKLESPRVRTQARSEDARHTVNLMKAEWAARVRAAGK